LRFREINEAPLNYTVNKGDTLSALAKTYGVSIADIAKASGVKNPNKLQIGQKLVIPGKTPVAPVPLPRPAPKSATSAPAAASTGATSYSGTDFSSEPNQPAGSINPLKRQDRLQAQPGMPLNPGTQVKDKQQTQPFDLKTLAGIPPTAASTVTPSVAANPDKQQTQPSDLQTLAGIPPLATRKVQTVSIDPRTGMPYAAPSMSAQASSGGASAAGGGRLPMSGVSTSASPGTDFSSAPNQPAGSINPFKKQDRLQAQPGMPLNPGTSNQNDAGPWPADYVRNPGVSGNNTSLDNPLAGALDQFAQKLKPNADYVRNPGVSGNNTSLDNPLAGALDKYAKSLRPVNPTDNPPVDTKTKSGLDAWLGRLGR